MKKATYHKIRISRKTKKFLKKQKYSCIFYRMWLFQLTSDRVAKFYRKYFGLTI